MKTHICWGREEDEKVKKEPVGTSPERERGREREREESSGEIRQLQ